MSATDLAWYKSSHSGSQGDDCIEVAVTTGTVHVRDSKDIQRPHLTVSRAKWRRFVGHLTAG
ncbi:DUF397 domain-containing protein [Streptomyces sp. NPDC001941]|uniref:DUF397 domain-containing protein n=1 Tax=Streptomyces sp. NPDC001941 TaxID=3154659 RepID=UPI00332D1505